jgi:hypothetical protein
MNTIRRAKNYYGTSQRKSSGAKNQSVSREFISTAVGHFAITHSARSNDSFGRSMGTIVGTEGASESP